LFGFYYIAKGGNEMIKVNKLKYGIMMVCEKTFTYNKELGRKIHLCTTLFTKDIEKIANGCLDPIFEETLVYLVRKTGYRPNGVLSDEYNKTIKEFFERSEEIKEIVNKCKQIAETRV
jgi:hypothetical protein